MHQRREDLSAFALVALSAFLLPSCTREEQSPVPSKEISVHPLAGEFERAISGTLSTLVRLQGADDPVVKALHSVPIVMMTMEEYADRSGIGFYNPDKGQIAFHPLVATECPVLTLCSLFHEGVHLVDPKIAEEDRLLVQLKNTDLNPKDRDRMEVEAARLRVGCEKLAHSRELAFLEKNGPSLLALNPDQRPYIEAQLESSMARARSLVRGYELTGCCVDFHVQMNRVEQGLSTLTAEPSKQSLDLLGEIRAQRPAIDRFYTNIWPSDGSAAELGAAFRSVSAALDLLTKAPELSSIPASEREAWLIPFTGWISKADDTADALRRDHGKIVSLHYPGRDRTW